MTPQLGILAYGSLIDHPGAEIESAIIGRIADVQTPFAIEFARSSTSRGNAPTLVPVEEGGRAVQGTILVVDLSESEAADRLWRRETNRVGRGGHYTHSQHPGPNTLIIDRHHNLAGVALVLSARFPPTIRPLTAGTLADLAIASARVERSGRDGITYLMNAKRNGITTPLSPAYEEEILRRTGTRSLSDALRKVQES